MLLIIAFLLAPLALTLLFLGEVPLGGGKRLPARRSRAVGAALLAFLPLAVVARLALGGLEDDYPWLPDTAAWGVFAVCMLIAAGLVFRPLFPARERRRPAVAPAAAEANSFDDVQEADVVPAEEEPLPAPAPPSKKGRKPAPGKNPFDFG